MTRKTAKSSFIQSPLIPVLGGIQPGIFSQISTLENKDNGFLDRLLVCYPDKDIEHYNRNAIDQEVLDWYEAYMSQFYNLIRKEVLQFNKFGEIEPRVIRFDNEAEQEWERIFNNITDMQNSDDISEYVKSMLSKQKVNFEGGLFIQRPLMYAELASGFFSRGDQFDTGYRYTDTALAVNMKFAYAGVTLLGTDDVFVS